MITIIVYEDCPNTLGMKPHFENTYSEHDLKNAHRLVSYYQKLDQDQKAFVVRCYKTEATGEITPFLFGGNHEQ